MLPSKELCEVLSQIQTLRESGEFDQERKFIEQKCEVFKGKEGYGRICEEAAWTYLGQSDMSDKYGTSPELKTIFTDLNKTKSLLQQSVLNYTGTTFEGQMKPDKLKEVIEAYKADKPCLSYYQRVRLRSICSSFGHLYSKMAMYSHGKQSDKLSQYAREFYQLKTVADPFYVYAMPALPESKINVVTQEEADKIRTAIASAK